MNASTIQNKGLIFTPAEIKPSRLSTLLRMLNDIGMPAFDFASWSKKAFGKGIDRREESVLASLRNTNFVKYSYI
ncbi:MAG: hypothetical protein KTR35_19380 [Gammaproteobacteria bacterium]|nr:hypothetical protein [Gammaproteobacteria bacterium]